MPEFRQNIATKDWVIIANERAKRPNAFIQVSDSVLTGENPAFAEKCPFCPGNEEINLGVECLPLHGPWQVRTVLNKYPALDQNENLRRAFDGVQRHIAGLGRHEIIVEHAAHNTTLALMKPAEIALVLEMFYTRGWSIQEDSRIEQIVYFKNHGKSAGASLVHPHSQLVAMPVVPNHIRQRTEEARRYFDDTGKCVFCVMLTDELKRNERLIVESEYFIAFVLYAATTPFHIWIMPRRHGVSFLYTDEEERTDLAVILQNVLSRLYVGLNDPAYNMVIRSAPVKEVGNTYLHWYVSILPRLSRIAGFEMGSGMYINPSLPEECAEFLQGINV